MWNVLRTILMVGSLMPFFAQAKHVEGEFLVKVKPGFSSESFRALGVEVKNQYEIVEGLYLVKSLSEGKESFAHLKSQPHFEYVDRNYLRHTAEFIDQKITPNVGKADPAIPALVAPPTEWESDPREHGNFGTHQNHTFKVWNNFGSIGTKETVIAIIDTGIDYTHPDLVANLWRNKGEIDGNGIDDDGNGYVDDVVGYDFVNKDSKPYDDHYHGTHVAGIAAATGGNGIGTVGQCPRCSIMGLKFISSDGWGSDADAILAIEYAWKNGAHVINSSWGSQEYSQALYDAFKASDEAGALNTIAAGNRGEDITVNRYYPARYALSGGMTTSALREVNVSILMPLWSNYAQKYSHISSAGEEVYSLMPEGKYARLSGTSMAAPGVAGCAGLIKSHFPDMSATEIKSIMMDVNHILFDPRSMRRTVAKGRVNMLKVFNALDK